MDERLIVIVGYDTAELLDIACVTTSLAMANQIGSLAHPYRVSVASPGGNPITCGSGLTLQSQQPLERLTGPLDTLIVSGGLGHERAAADPRLVGHVRRLAKESRRVASVCTGAGILAATGLLDGRRATTHWRYASQLAAQHPEITVDSSPIYIRDGDVYTAAGITSALDLTLAFIEDDHGAELGRQVARDLVTYLQRPGNQAQMSLFTTAPAPKNDMVRQLIEHITSHLDHDLNAAALAARAGVTPRHLTRLFLEHLGQPPARFIRQARTEAAAHLLASTALPLAGVAKRCGFGSAETLRQAFTSRYGISPSRYRATQTARSAT
ncbi:MULTISPECIES: DJ-1/PfpI family protein [unclassified Streptomyces]|uniref:GlxA family transcriptional regulator n=1 Tax=unclassified Streptomyces TaxID=2593676 RepID=UPI002DDC3B0A|nr:MULTISPECIES: DJ-1/PfpI family protein [unclassified Streptomyces]WSC58274.1 DJ-1/PfpI family protein [Streptomyces sp. NBC_01761]WSJ55577.1 DJ-1/PfpI family protein [Streptomyces sp. NBC_01318]